MKLEYWNSRKNSVLMGVLAFTRPARKRHFVLAVCVHLHGFVRHLTSAVNLLRHIS